MQDSPSAIVSTSCCFSMQETPKLCWMITTACNLACRHCAVFDNPFVEAFGGVTCRDDVSRVLRFIVRCGVRSVVITGGEPTLSPWLDSIVAAVYEHGRSLSLSTNATRLTKPFVTRLTRLGLGKATVSVDGATAVTHDHLRGGGAFEAALKGLRLLVAEGVAVTAGVFVRKEIIPEIDEILALCEREGVGKLSLLWPVQQGRCRRMQADLVESSPDKLANRFRGGAGGRVTVEIYRPRCTDDGCPSGRTIYGAIGGHVLPGCVYKPGSSPNLLWPGRVGGEGSPLLRWANSTTRS